MKRHSLILSLIATIVIALCGVFSTGCADQAARREKIYLERADKAVALYNQLCRAITVIMDNNQKYVRQMTAKIEDGSFSEDEDESAFNQMFSDIDVELKRLNIYGLCDSLSNGNLKDSEDFAKWPQELKSKAESLESLISEIRTIGFKVAGFNERKEVWENEPWASANSPYYRDLPSIPDRARKVDEIGHRLDKIIPGTYSSFYSAPTEAKKLEKEAIDIFDSNRNKAIELFTSAAQSGQEHSMYCLGLIADEKGDTEVARKWYEKAAVAGSTKAMIELALNYYSPLNQKHQAKSKADRRLAKKWYQRAANFGNPRGDYYMALNYYSGWYDERDYKTADNYCSVGIVLHSAECANLKGALQSDRNNQIKYFRLALTFDPDYIPAKLNVKNFGFN